MGIYGRIKTAFVGATVTMKIGTSIDDDCIMMPISLTNTRNLSSHLQTTSGKNFGMSCIYGAFPEVRYNDAVPLITFTSSDNNLSSLTAGEVELIVCRIVPDE